MVAQYEGGAGSGSVIAGTYIRITAAEHLGEFGVGEPNAVRHRGLYSRLFPPPSWGTSRASAN